jgi:DNA-binding GntR family transcriptional regulator
MTTLRKTEAFRQDRSLSQLRADSLDRRAPLRGQIYTLVRRLIVTGALRSGEPVGEIAIAERLGVSRTPVREAVKRLSDEGLIDVYAQSGTFVSQVSAKAIEEAFIIRTALELESVARAAPLMDGRHAENLRAIMNRHEDRLADNRFADAIDADDDFHRYIAGINQMAMLWRAVDISKAHMDRGRLMMLPKPGQAAQTLKHHAAIFRALVARDSVAATQAMRKHLTVTQRDILHHVAAEGGA